MKTANDFFIKTISPIHIGCDEIYEPTGFTIDEQLKQMIVFDPFSFISQLEISEKAKFTDICSKGTISSILEIFHFLKNRSVKGRAISLCQGFIDHYNKTLGLPLNNEKLIKNELNNFQIPRTAFCSIDQRPYIPGSSIKGALRTAYLNMMEKEKKLSAKVKERNAKNLEQKLINYDEIPSDPFRMVKISDFMPVGEVKTKIIYGINKKKSPSDRDTQGAPTIFETVQPGSVFSGTITVNSPLPGSDIKESVTLEKLLKSAFDFYAKEKDREDNELSNIGVQPKENSEEIKKMKNSVLLRVGRHSGAESVTVEGHRSIFIMGKKGEKKKTYKNHATTIWLSSDSKKPSSVNNLEPFGWAYLADITDDLSNTFKGQEKEWQDKTKRIAEEEQLAAERQRQLERQAAEEEKKKAAEEAERIKEEERRKTALEAMSPEERDSEAFSNPGLLEQQVIEIYNRLDGFSEENKIRLAQELKEYWIKNIKWEKKDCSKKQITKVSKVKKILGEIF